MLKIHNCWPRDGSDWTCPRCVENLGRAARDLGKGVVVEDLISFVGAGLSNHESLYLKTGWMLRPVPV